MKYDAKAKANPMFIAHAYAETQPDPIFDEEGLKQMAQQEAQLKAEKKFKPNE